MRLGWHIHSNPVSRRSSILSQAANRSKSLVPALKPPTLKTFPPMRPASKALDSKQPAFKNLVQNRPAFQNRAPMRPNAFNAHDPKRPDSKYFGLKHSTFKDPHYYGSKDPAQHRTGSEAQQQYDSKAPAPHQTGSKAPAPHRTGSKAPVPHRIGSQAPAPHQTGSKAAQHPKLVMFTLEDAILDGKDS